MVSIQLMLWIYTLFGGDQLTCVRARSANWLRCSHDSPEFALQGIVPVVEDWHARMCLLRVCLQFVYDNNDHF